MDRYLAIIVVLIIGVIVLMCGYYSNLMNNKEKFDANENENNENSTYNPHRLHLVPLDESCENVLDKNTFVSVQEFMDGKRYNCY